MYNSSGLIPARFLILISHFIISVTLLWNKEETARACSSEAISLNLESALDNYHIQWAIGLSLMISFLVFELLVFVFGFTMFNSNSALISIGGHALACVFLTGLVLHGWQCGWFWWIFSFGSALPFMYDIMQLLDVLIHRKY